MLGSDERSFLTSIRSFGRAGFAVDVAWYADEAGLALTSRYVRDRIALPPPDPSGGWIEQVNRLVDERGYDFVMPCHEPQAVPLQEHAARLAQPERFALVPSPGFELASNKHELHAIARSCGVPVPEQIHVTSPQDILAAAHVLGWPLYLKPERTTEAANPLSRRDVERLDGPDQIAGIPAEALCRGYRAQRAVEGHGMGVNILAWQGRILAALQQERLHEPPAGGGSSYRRTVPLDPTLLDYCGRLMERIGYTGPAMVEFKAGCGGAQPYLMEINTRMWGSLPLTVAAGFDVPLFWYQMLREGRRDFPQRFRPEVYCRNWTLDLNWLGSNAQALRAGGTHTITVPFNRVARELAGLPFGREHSDTLTLDDPKPGLLEAKRILGRTVRKSREKMRPGRALERMRSTARVRDAGSILFVCYGNICRSPFAGVLATELLPGARVISAGLHHRTDRPSPAEAVAVADQMGVSLAGHRSQLLTIEMLEAADVVFVFDRSNEAGVRALHPASASKIVYLGAWSRSLEIADPWGQPRSGFTTCYESISEALRGIATLRATRR